MSPYLFVILYFFICGLYLIRMRHSPEKGNRVIFKVLPIGMLLAATMAMLGQRVVLTIKNGQFLPRVYTLGGGLLFHCMTFIYHEFSSLFVYSSICYSISLGIYIYGFSESFDLFKNFESSDVAVLVVVMTFSIFVFLYMFTKLDFLTAMLFGLQLILESVFLVVQIVLISKSFLPYVYLGAGGAFVMYLSDILMPISNINSVPYLKASSMAMNYLGSLMVTGSVILVVL